MASVLNVLTFPSHNVQFISNTEAGVYTAGVMVVSTEISVSVSVEAVSSLLVRCTEALDLVELYDPQGNLIGQQGGTTAAIIGLLQPDVSYVLQFHNAVEKAEGDLIYALGLSKDVTNSAFFENGIVPAVSQSASLNYAFNDFGGLTFTFTAFPLVAGQLLPLATVSNALKDGTLNVVSSDQSVYTTKAFTFVIGEFLNLTMVPLKTTVFTGTIYYNCDTAGTSVPQSLLVVPGPV